jgi:hypothetical protein
VEWLRAGQREGQVREDVDVSAVAAEYVAYTSGITYLWLLSAETFNFDSANQAMKNYLRTTLSVHSQESI